MSDDNTYAPFRDWPPNYHSAYNRRAIEILQQARYLASEARAFGLILTINQQQSNPAAPAMGHTEDVVTVTPRRILAGRKQ